MDMKQLKKIKNFDQYMESRKDSYRDIKIHEESKNNSIADIDLNLLSNELDSDIEDKFDINVNEDKETDKSDDECQDDECDSTEKQIEDVINDIEEIEDCIEDIVDKLEDAIDTLDERHNGKDDYESCLVFDGTSYYVTSCQEAIGNDELEIIKKSNNLDILNILCDKMNDAL